MLFLALLQVLPVLRSWCRHWVVLVAGLKSKQYKFIIALNNNVRIQQTKKFLPACQYSRITGLHLTMHRTNITGMTRNMGAPGKICMWTLLLFPTLPSHSFPPFFAIPSLSLPCGLPVPTYPLDFFPSPTLPVSSLLLEVGPFKSS